MGRGLTGAEFAKLYSTLGPPERLFRARLFQALFRICSERRLLKQLDYNLLFRWFVVLGTDVAVWMPKVFTKNRDHP